MSFYDYLPSLQTRPGATELEIGAAQEQLREVLPEAYRTFLLETNGAEGSLGSGYVALWPIERLPEENEAAAEFLNGFVVFGSDGGGEAYAFDCRSEGTRPVVQVPFATYDVEDVEVVGLSFDAWLDAMSRT